MIRRGIGVQSFVSAGGDADAQAFITAAGITDATQQSAINTLVTDLKGYGIWSKMKAIYPFVGGTSSAHKWNLKDPRDLDAAFRLVFSGGITHSSTGVLFNGTNGFSNTYLSPSSSLTQNSQSYSYYSRSNTAAGTKRDMGGVLTGDLTQDVGVLIRYTSNLFYPIIGGNNYPSVTNNDSRGLYIANRVNSTTIKGFKNNSLAVSGNQDSGLLSRAIYIGARNKDNAPEQYTDRECAFASIGDGLTDTEAANLYTAVQAYQTTLGRSVGTQTVSDSDAQAFVNAAVIEDQVQATAINTLVTDLKGYGIWSKMKAIYPFVGGTSSTHKWNLKDPRDLDAAFRLVFSGGITHSSTGVLFNGTNGFSNTYLSPSSSLSLNSTHFSYYSRTNNTYSGVMIGTSSTGNGQSLLALKVDAGVPQEYSCIHNNATADSSPSRNDGLFTATRIASGSFKVFRNSTAYRNSSITSTSLSTTNFYVGARNNNNSATQYTALECAFASIGDGLTDTEAANLYTAVQAYQTSLSRNV